MKDSLRIVIQKKGRLKDESLKFLAERGIEVEGKALKETCPNTGVEVIFVRNGDIPVYVEQNAADLGITGQNILWEKGLDAQILSTLGFGKCDLVLAAPAGVTYIAEQRIATSYPNSLKKYLSKKGENAAVVEIQGSVEVTPELDLADLVCDIRQSGRTLKEHGLEVVDTIYQSQAVLITNKYSLSKKYEKLFG